MEERSGPLEVSVCTGEVTTRAPSFPWAGKGVETEKDIKSFMIPALQNYAVGALHEKNC